MMGTEEDPGIIPRLCITLFDRINAVSMRCRDPSVLTRKTEHRQEPCLQGGGIIHGDLQ